MRTRSKEIGANTAIEPRSLIGKSVRFSQGSIAR